MSIIRFPKARSIDFLLLLVVSVICSLLVTGCSPRAGAGDATPALTPTLLPAAALEPGADPTLAPGQFTTASGAPFPVPSTEANLILTLDKEAAWGKGLPIKQIPASIDADHVLMLEGVAANGKFIVALVMPRNSTSMETTQLVRVDPANRQIIDTLPMAPQSGSSAYYIGGHVAVDGDWIVWCEGNVFAVYNAATRSRTDIKANVTTDVMPLANASYSVDHGILVWSEAPPAGSQPEKDRIGTVIKSADLATGRVTVLGVGGMSPSISWPLVAWREPDLSTDANHEGQMTSRVIILNLETGEKRRLSGLWDANEIALHGDSLAWTGGGVGMAFLSNLQETRRQIISPLNGYTPQHITLNDRIVAWSSLGIPQVWDRDLERLVMLGGYSNGSATQLVNGPTLAWQSAARYNDWPSSGAGTNLPDDLTIYVLDTSQIPKQ